MHDSQAGRGRSARPRQDRPARGRPGPAPLGQLTLSTGAKPVFSGSLNEDACRRLRSDLPVVTNGVGGRRGTDPPV